MILTGSLLVKAGNTEEADKKAESESKTETKATSEKSDWLKLCLVYFHLMSTESPTSLELLSSTLLRMKKMIAQFLGLDETSISKVTSNLGRKIKVFHQEIASVNWQPKPNI